MLRRRTMLVLDSLETRLAPATLVNPHTVTWVDHDDHTVTVKISLPVFEPTTINDVFEFLQGSVNGNNDSPQSLQNLNLSILAAGGAALTVSVSPPKFGTGFSIDATGLDLSEIVMNGNINGLTVGDADLTTPGLGSLQCTSLLGPMTIQGDLGKITLTKSLIGFLDVNGSIGSLKMTNLNASAPADTGRIHADGNIGSVIVKGIVSGSSGARTGLIDAGGDIGSVRVGGSLFGGSGLKSARIEASGDIGTVKIGGDLIAEQGIDSGTIFTKFGTIHSVKIGGSIIGGTGVRSGSIRARVVGNIKVVGDLDGSNGVPVVLSGAGDVASGLDTDVAISSIKIGGNVTNAQILAGFNDSGSPFNGDAQIGSIRVGGNWTRSNIAAGVNAGTDQLFGTNDDSLIDEGSFGEANITARIDKIIIRGTADGTTGGTDGFGIVAEEIGSLSIDGVLIALSAGKSNDTTALGTTGDFKLRELG